MSTKTTFKRVALVAVAALVDIHSLRCTYAYLLKQQGVHVTIAQRLLGHSDPRVTMNVYTQVLDNEIDDVGLLLSKAAGF